MRKSRGSLRRFVFALASGLGCARAMSQTISPVSDARSWSDVVNLDEFEPPGVSGTQSYNGSYASVVTGNWVSNGTAQLAGEFTDLVKASTTHFSQALSSPPITDGTITASAIWDPVLPNGPGPGDIGNATATNSFNFSFTTDEPLVVSFNESSQSIGSFFGGAFLGEGSTTFTGPGVGTEIIPIVSSAGLASAGGSNVYTASIYPNGVYTVSIYAYAYVAGFDNSVTTTSSWNLSSGAGTTIGTYVPPSSSASSNYSNPGNWNTVPNGACQIAYFPQAPVPETISLDVDVTLGTVTFDSTNPYTINGPGTLTIYCPADGGHLNVLNGNQTINALTTLESDTIVDIVNPTDSLTLTALQPSAVNVTKLDPGSGIVNSLQLTSLTINAGTLQVLASSGPGGRNSSISVLSSLNFAGTTGAWAGVLDLTNNDLIVHNGSIGTITNQTAQGYNGGNWQGAGGILSSAAASDVTHLTAQGVVQNSMDGTTSGTALYAIFDGQTVSASDVLVKYTYYGDANLDGEVDGSDYSLIDNAYSNNQNTSSTALTGWFNGDFNYDGVIDGSDYTLIDNAFNNQGASMAATITATSTANVAEAMTAVPEPSIAGLLAFAGIGFFQLSRRRTSSKY